MKYFVVPSEDRRLDPVSREHLRGSFVELSDGVTHYELSGPDSGDLVLLLGGLTIPLTYWDGVISPLHERGLRTLTVSGYGRGYSDRVEALYDESLFVRQVSELIRRLDIAAPQHVVGTSMGALIAMEYARQHATSISTLTFSGPVGLARRSPSPRWLLRSDRLTTLVARRLGRRLLGRHLGHNIQDRVRAKQLAEMVLDAYRYEGSMYAFFATLQSIALFDRAKLYQRTGLLDLPTMILWGADDRVTPITDLELARTLLKPLECHVVKDCGHMAPFERPREVAELIGAFAVHRAGRPSS